MTGERLVRLLAVPRAALAEHAHQLDEPRHLLRDGRGERRDVERGEMVGRDGAVESTHAHLAYLLVGQPEVVQHVTDVGPLSSAASFSADSTSTVSHCATRNGPVLPAASTTKRWPSTTVTPAAIGSTRSARPREVEERERGRISISTPSCSRSSSTVRSATKGDPGTRYRTSPARRRRQPARRRCRRRRPRAWRRFVEVIEAVDTRHRAGCRAVRWYRRSIRAMRGRGLRGAQLGAGRTEPGDDDPRPRRYCPGWARAAQVPLRCRVLADGGASGGTIASCAASNLP